MRRLIQFTLAVLMVVAWVGTKAHQNGDGQPASPLLKYGLLQGMSQSLVVDIVQDSSGFLWLATQLGVNRFDGASFQHITTTEGLRHNSVSALIATSNQKIWAGDKHGGLSLIEGLQVISTVQPAVGQSHAVTSLVEILDNIYVATSGSGIQRLEYRTDQAVLMPFVPTLRNTDQLVAGDTSTLLARVDRQLFAINLAGPNKPTLVADDITALWGTAGRTLAANAAGDLGSWDNGQLRWTDQTISQTAKNNGGHRAGLPLRAIALDNLDQPWVAGTKGVIQLGSDTPRIDLPDVVELFIDREHVMWLASHSGLFRHLGQRIEHFWLKLNEVNSPIFAITGNDQGVLYFGSTRDLYRRQPDGELERLRESLDLPSGTVQALIIDADGRRIWAGYKNAGVFLIDPDRLSKEHIPGTGGKSILDLQRTPNGDVWMGTAKDGLLRYQPHSKTLTTISAEGAIYTLIQEAGRWLWFGEDNSGLKRLDLTQPELPPVLMKSTQEFGRDEFNQLALQDGGLWIAMSDGGVFYLSDQELWAPDNDPVKGQTVYAIASLPDGTVMMGTETGLYQLDPATEQYVYYGRLAGFQGQEANAHATYFAPNGDLWIGTMAGASRVRTDLPMPTIPPPGAAVTSVVAGDQQVPIANGGQVAANLRKIRIDFGAVSTRNPGHLQYRYRLLGLDENWSSADATRSVNYNDLSGGEYRFQVQARKRAGELGDTSEWAFTVLAPVWEKHSFWALIVMLLMGATVSLMRYRSRRISMANERLQLQVAERTKSLELSNQKLAFQATYDELTGLYNRRSFQEHLGQAWEAERKSGWCCYLLYLDLDQFKIVNDTCGHAAGDELLRQVAELIKSNVRNDDVVGRLGGDEFGIILRHCPADTAVRVAENVRQQVEEFQFHWETENFRIGVSIGAVPIEKERGDTEELQQQADAACYAAKEAGRNQLHVVTDASDVTERQRGEMRWVRRLQDAMDNNLFALFEQKILPLHDQEEPERVEVLLRMREPANRRLIPPGAFLPAAERYGLGARLDEWVVSNLLKSLFIHSQFKASGRRYWVNLSGLSVGDPQFCESLVKMMTKSDLPAGMMNFEITETAVIRNIAEASRLIDALRDMGCEFALDDFGSGLSSFGYLKKLNVDYVKIDGMFVRDIVQDHTDRIFVRSIIDIAHELNIRTVAEYVESKEILTVVKELGADYAQGFGIQRPQLLAPIFPMALNQEEERSIG